MATTVPTFGIGHAGDLAATMGYGNTIVVEVLIPDKACVLIGADPSARIITSADGSVLALVSANPEVRALIAADPSFKILTSADPRANVLRGRKGCC